jgi:NAD-dependent dihydropyrimidine dehydrogenase PreA subunit
MVNAVLRKIVHIDEDKCNGCGACVPSCAEGALRIIDGKARLISETYCDGLGACLGKCPQDAIRVEERLAPDFDEKAVEHHLSQTKSQQAHACPSTAVAEFERHHEQAVAIAAPSRLRHWPVQLTLIAPGAPFLKRADVVLAADCVAFAHAGFHQTFLTDHSLIIACPKLDDFHAHLAKLTEVLKKSDIKSLTVVHMEVPCCGGLNYMAREAIKASGCDIPLHDVTIGVKGEIKAGD